MDDILNDGGSSCLAIENLGTELDAFYDNDDSDNFLKRLNIDSNYYEINEIKPPSSGTSYKYCSMHINIQGLMSSIENLKHIINRMEHNSIQIDFVCLCETFLFDHNTDNTFKSLCHIPGYQFVFKNRENRTKGGVAIYIRNNHTFKTRDDLSIFIEGEYETIFVEINSKPNNLIIGEIYRVPNTPEKLSVERYDATLSTLINNKNCDIILGSDINFDFLKINQHTHTADLFNTFIGYGLIPTITKPTRITHCTASLIDNLFAKIPSDQSIKSGIMITKISDHLPIFTFIGNSPKKNKIPMNIKYRELNETNINKIQYSLQQFNWSILNTLQTNEAYDTFVLKLKNTIDQHAPEITKTIPYKHKIREPWVTKGLMKSSNNLDKLYKKCINKSNEHPSRNKFKKHRNLFNTLKRIMKQNYYRDLFDKYKYDIRKTWGIIRTIINKNNDKSNIADSFHINNKEINNPTDIANSFCDYFTNVGPQLSNQIPQSRHTYVQYLNKQNITSNRSLYLAPTDSNEINRIIKLLKNKKSSGVIGSDVPWLECPACNALTWVITVTE